MQPKKSKIMFFSHSARCYGAEKSFLTLIKNLDPDKFSSIVIIPENGPIEPELQKANLDYHIVNTPKWITWGKKPLFESFKIKSQENKALGQLLTIANEFKPDLIYTNSIVTYSGANLAGKLNIPHIWHIREILPGNPGLRPMYPLAKTYRITEEKSSRIIAISNAVKNQFPDSVQNKIDVIYNFVEFPENSKDTMPESTLELLYAGSIIQRKGADVALEAVGKIVTENRLPCSIKFTLIGEGRTFLPTLKNICDKYNLNDMVEFKGHQDNVIDYIKKTHILLVPSHDEPWGRVVVEAMLNELPVIGANAGGIPEIISHNQTGILAEPGNYADWAEKICHTYNNYHEALNFAKNGRRQAKEKYSLDNYVGKIEAIIDEIVR